MTPLRLMDVPPLIETSEESVRAWKKRIPAYTPVVGADRLTVPVVLRLMPP
jgi:hypothetical protein